MEKFLFFSSIGLLFLQGRIYSCHADQKSGELDNFNTDQFNAYCFSMTKPLMGYLLKVKDKIEAHDQMKIQINDLENQIKDNQAALALKDNSLKEKDQQLEDLKNQRNRRMDQHEAENCLPFVNSTDIQVINVPGIYPFRVPCDSQIAGSGWTVIQRRVSGNVNFNKSWEKYKNGFGNLRENFFIGLEKIHLMTQNQPHELYIQLRDLKNETRYARFDNFNVGSEDESYELKSVGKYSGTAGDWLSYHKNRKFSTSDRDNDDSTGNCADNHDGGWWFGKCAQSSLNGKYHADGVKSDKFGIFWGQWNNIDFNTSLTYVQMMIRPISQ